MEIRALKQHVPEAHKCVESLESEKILCHISFEKFLIKYS